MTSNDRPRWTSAKYVYWPPSHPDPLVRVPTPAGTPESHTVSRRAGEDEASLFARCLAYRDRRGPEVWGARRWAELVGVAKRSVAKHHREPAGPIPGVNHYQRPNASAVWTALWYERQPDGTTKKRSKQFSYGTANSRFATSEQAMAAAVELREAMAARWYSVLERGDERTANRLED